MREWRDKKVAVLSPVAWRTPPQQYGAWETVASNMAEGLGARGWDVTLFATADSITPNFDFQGFDENAGRIYEDRPKQKQA